MKFDSNKFRRIWAGTLLVLFACAALGSTGCMVKTNGVVLPSPWYHKNQVQYFPRGPEYPFQNEVSTLQDADRGAQR
jgi:hypothetical protein